MPSQADKDKVHRIRVVKWFYHLMAIAGLLLFTMWQSATMLYAGIYSIDVGLYAVTVLLVGAGVVGSLLYRELEKEAMAGTD